MWALTPESDPFDEFEEFAQQKNARASIQHELGPDQGDDNGTKPDCERVRHDPVVAGPCDACKG